MLQLKNTKNKEGFVSNTQIAYTKAPIQGNVDSITNDQSLRLQFKASDMQLCDIANSTLNFTLTIRQFVVSDQQGNILNTNALVPNESVMDLLEVQSVSFNGIRMNLQQLNYAGMLYRRVRSKCRGEQYRITTGQCCQPENIQTYGFGDLIPTAAPDANGFKLEKAGTKIGIFPDTDVPAMQQFLGSQIGGKNDLVVGSWLGEQERFRLLNQVQRHYSRDSTGDAHKIAPIYTQLDAKGDIYRQYSIKLGELIPELQNFTICDKSLFTGSGLEIQLNTLNPTLCMQLLPFPPASTVDNGQRTALDAYTLSNIYIGMVLHKTMSPTLGMMPRVPFTSIYHTKAAITQNQANHQFSLNAGCLVQGVIVIYSPGTMDTSATNRPKFNTVALGETQPGYNQLSKAYFQNQQILETVLQIGNQTYNAQASPPTTNKSLWYYQIAQSYSEQVMGISYSTSFERFLTIDFCQFIPIQRVVKVGEIFQFYQSYQTDVNFASKELNLLVVCNRNIDFAPDGTVSIENM